MLEIKNYLPFINAYGRKFTRVFYTCLSNTSNTSNTPFPIQANSWLLIDDLENINGVLLTENLNFLCQENGDFLLY